MQPGLGLKGRAVILGNLPLPTKAAPQKDQNAFCGTPGFQGNHWGRGQFGGLICAGETQQPFQLAIIGRGGFRRTLGNRIKD